jgi:hypothetical protein
MAAYPGVVTYAPGHTTDSRTRKMVLEASRLTGISFYVVQGSYSEGSASAGTHSGGGALDPRTWDKTTAQINSMVRNLRIVGFAAWYRTRSDGFAPHIHAIAIGQSDLSSAAERQVIAYYDGRNGLANDGPDTGPRLDPIPTWESYLASELPDTGEDMPPQPYWSHRPTDIKLKKGAWVKVVTVLAGKGIMGGVVRLQVDHVPANSNIDYMFREVAPGGKVHSDIGSGRTFERGGSAFLREPYYVKNETGGNVEMLVKAPADGLVVADVQLEGQIWR